MLIKTMSIIKKVIKGRLLVQYYIQIYRGDELRQKITAWVTIKFLVLHIYILNSTGTIGKQGE